MAAYFCWLCGLPWDAALAAATHYENGRPVRFCCRAHRAEYEWLARQ